MAGERSKERIFALTSHGPISISPPPSDSSNLMNGNQCTPQGGIDREGRKGDTSLEPYHWSDEDLPLGDVNKTKDSSINDFLYGGRNVTDGGSRTSNDVPDITNNTRDEAEISDFLQENKMVASQGEDGGISVDEEGKTKETIESVDKKERTFSDGYFDQSIEKIYDRYNKRKLDPSEDTEGASFPDSSTSSDEQPTGCFDRTKEDEIEKPFFQRCIQKKYIVLATTALSMLLALTTAIILTINVFHVTDSQHNHARHFHGDQRKTADSAEMYQKASIASDSGNCSRIGSDILKQNGSAVDAAITVCFCIGVANRYSSGIGGGGYMLIYNRENKTFEALDFREAAPGRIKSNFYDKDYNASRYGGMSIGVPGEVKGLYTAWKKYGKLPWKDLVQPSVDLAANGIPASQALIDIIELMDKHIQVDPGLSNLYLDKLGDRIKLGTNVIDKELANTLAIIRDDPMDFYSGDLAARVVHDVREAGGVISFDDLERFEVRQTDVIQSTIDNLNIHSLGAPSGGPVVMAIINILKGYNFKRDDMENPHKQPLTYHRIIEAMKFAFGEKAREGDPKFNPGYEKALMTNMTSEELGSKFRRLINDTSTLDLDNYYGDEYFMLPNESGTTHVSVIAENGDAVAVSTTINEWFGSTNRSSITGIIYNNEMNDFTIPQENQTMPAAPWNGVRSGKRPASSMSPLILTDNSGNVKMVVGGVGGKRIIPAVAQVIMNKVWFEDDLGRAITRPRVYNFLQPPLTYVEGKSLETNLKSFLQKCNQSYEVVDPYNYAAVQAVYVEKQEGGIYAKSDWRKISGHSAGY
ncbi:glutathione hydrolase 1 proenzyme-like [Clytia hemisphaerica]|uniref:Uncharacterized protein n=1 Tax=Clytia hemisphaerica TaxID=252671 RepID=A0A7M5XJG4_9CNID